MSIRSLKKPFTETDPHNIQERDTYHYNLGVDDASKYHDEYVERIDSRLAYMFVNAPETYHAIKQIIYAE